MSANDGKNDIRLTDTEERDITMRCINLVEYLSDTANRIIFHFVKNIPCEEAKKILLENPESLALRALEHAWKNVSQTYKPDQVKH